MKDILGMQALERLEHCADDAKQRGLRNRGPLRTQPLLEGLPTVVRHYHVGGAILLPESIDLDECRVVESGQQPGLVDETAQPGLESRSVPLGLDDDREVVPTCGQSAGHELLDRDLPVQLLVAREIDNAEAALTERGLDDVFVQPVSRRKDVAVVRCGRCRMCDGLSRRSLPAHSSLTGSRPRTAAAAGLWHKIGAELGLARRA